MHRVVTRMRGGGDRGDIVLGWLTKVTVVLALAGLLLFDAITLGVGAMQVQDRAATAGRAAVQDYADRQDVQSAYDAAVLELAEYGVTDTLDPEKFRIDPADGSVTLTVERTSPTLVIEKIGPIRGWATTHATTTVRRAV
jgi:hypothetical protein